MTQDEYATFLYYFGARYQSKAEQAELIPDVLFSLQNSEWAHPDERELPIAGAVMAFFELYPDRKHRWQADYPELRRMISRAVMKSQECPEWTDFHLAQWLVLRREGSIDAILDRVADGRELALEKLHAFAAESVPFQKALRKARDARKMAMLIN
jgi:hypothetical protein